MSVKEYKDRSYRRKFDAADRRSFTVKYKETDLWIGVDVASYVPQMRDVCQLIVNRLRAAMDAYAATDTLYMTSFVPCEARRDAPKIFHDMAAVCAKTHIGPMSAVAGAVAREVAVELKREYPYREIIIENGGDIYAELTENVDISVFAGESPLSERVGLCVEAKESPLGVCTSSGTVGPSVSFGSADAVMIVCKDVLLADSYATAFANQIHSIDDISSVIERINDCPDILAAIVIKDDKMGISGSFQMRLFQ